MLKFVPLVLLIPLCVFGQETVIFDQLTQQDGLSYNDIPDIMQDSKGYMWFATDQGLNRYDGYEFKQFLHQVNDTTSLGYNGLRALMEDSHGFIWVGHMAGVSRMDPATHQFKTYRNDPDDQKSLSNDFVQSLCESQDGKIWIGTAYGGVSIFDPATENFTHLKNDSANPNSLISDYWIYDIHQDQHGKMWIATQEGLDSFDAGSGNFEHHLETKDYHPNWRQPFTKSSVYSIYEDSLKNCLWIGRQGGIVQYDFHKDNYTNYPFQEDIQAFSITADGSGGLFVSGINGLIHIKEAPVNSGEQLPELQPIQSGQMRRITRDNTGILWVATLHNGAFKLDPNRIKAHHFNSENFVKVFDGNSEVIRSLTEDNRGNTFIGTMGNGLIQYNQQNEKFKYLKSDPAANSLSYNYIWELFTDHYGIIWIGTITGGLDKYDPQSEVFKNYRAAADGSGALSFNNVSAIIEDQDLNLWVGYVAPGLTKLTMNHEAGFNREPVSSTHYYPDRDNPNLGATLDLEEDQYGNIWAAKMNGLFKFDKAQDKFIKQPLSSFGKERALAVHEDAEGTLWAGSDLGLFRAEIVSGYKENDSLRFIRIFKNWFNDAAEIIEDQSNRLWIITINGSVYSINLDSLSVEEVDFEIIQSNKGASTWSSFINQQGYIMLPRGYGFMKFHPDSIRNNQNIPPVVFTDFQLDGKSVKLTDSLKGKPVLKAMIDHTEKIVLPYGQNFSIEFAALNYTNPEKNQYSYTLEGFHENWSPPSITRTAAFTNLWEGDYTLRVRAANNDGIWNEKGSSIKITILPPWYRGKIAWIIYGGLLVFALVGARKVIVEREREKAKHQMEHLELKKAQEMDQMKTQFFTNISHEFRTPLTLILGPLKQMYEGTFKGDPHTVMGVMIRNGKRLLQLINQLLDFSKLETGKVKLQASVGDLVEFVRTMFAAFESTAQSRKIRYVFQSDVSSLPTYYDRDKLEKVITNLLSNAFKFTDNEGSIEIHMTKNIEDPEVDKGEGLIEISIRDNGKGVPEEKLPRIFDRFYQADESSTRQQEGTGIGLALARELVELHHGTIKATSQKGETSFIIHLPVGRIHLDDSQVVVRKGYQEIDTSTLEILPVQATASMESANGDDSLPLILIIDDNEDMRLYLREVLGGHYRLVEATNGEEGWDCAHDNIPDLVLSDVMMPEMDGHELCQKLKTDEHTSHIPVILLTARAGEKAKLEGLETGADDYVTKPFSAEELRARIHNLIEIRQKLREQFSSSLSLEPKDLAITSADERFLQRALDIMEIHRSDADFSTEAFIKEIGMSRTHLHRKLKALTDQSAGEFIRSYRLKYARQLIQKEYGNMAQVAYECGFNNPSYFAECFKKQFGILPSEFAKEQS